MEKQRNRKWGLLLYMEFPPHKEALEKLIEEDGVSWKMAYIVHDKDVSEETDELKKEHIHVVLECNNAIWNTALSKQLGIKENYIQPIRHYENALEYLIHYKDADKFQYSIDEVKGCLKLKLSSILSKDGNNEEERAISLLEYILNFDGCIKVSDVLRWSAQNGYFDIFRRSSSIYMAVIQEHNNAFINNN